MSKSACPSFFLAELQLYWNIADLVLDNPIVTHISIMQAKGTRDLLMWEVDAGILRSDVINDTFQTIQKSDHGKIEPTIMQQPANMQVPRAVKLVGSFGGSDLLNTRERAHRNEPIWIKCVIELASNCIKKQERLTPSCVYLSPLDLQPYRVSVDRDSHSKTDNVPERWALCQVEVRW